MVIFSHFLCSRVFYNNLMAAQQLILQKTQLLLEIGIAEIQLLLEIDIAELQLLPDFNFSYMCYILICLL